MSSVSVSLSRPPGQRGQRCMELIKLSLMRTVRNWLVEKEGKSLLKIWGGLIRLTVITEELSEINQCDVQSLVVSIRKQTNRSGIATPTNALFLLHNADMPIICCSTPCVDQSPSRIQHLLFIHNNLFTSFFPIRIPTSYPSPETLEDFAFTNLEPSTNKGTLQEPPSPQTWTINEQKHQIQLSKHGLFSFSLYSRFSLKELWNGTPLTPKVPSRTPLIRQEPLTIQEALNETPSFFNPH